MTNRAWHLGLVGVFVLSCAPPVLAAEVLVEEIRVPAFDTEEVEASYALVRPSGGDSEARRPLPLILDLHGAIHPSRRGGTLTARQVWSRFVEEVPCVVAAPNARTRGWNRIQGEKDDRAYVRHVLQAVREAHPVDESRIYLAGFSSGADFVCSGGLQRDGPFAGSLVVCPGPPNVVGIKNGALARVKDHPFVFATGEEDYIRKSGAFEAFLHLTDLGGRAAYREVPGVGHAFFGVEEYVRLFRTLEHLAHPSTAPGTLELAREARARDDYLTAAQHTARAKAEGKAEAAALLDELRAAGDALAATARAIDAEADPGRAYEAWWRVRTQFHAFAELAEAAQKALAAIAERVPARDLYRARRDWFERRSRGGDDPPPPREAPARPVRPPEPPLVGKGPFAFDRYLDAAEIAAALAELARRHPRRARLVEMGESVEGRPLLALEVTNLDTGAPETKPALYVQGALHGHEVSSAMVVLYAAWQLVENPKRSRTTARILERSTVYLVPAANPDAVHHFAAGPHSRWRPRFNFRPHDADGDGRVDEDAYEDLDGDDEIALMYRPDPEGPYVREGDRIRRGQGTPRYALVGREGLDDDGDGKFSEDPPGGVDLNRNFPVGFRSRRFYEGTTGEEAASEPETGAVMAYVRARPNIVLFHDVHNNARCLFAWLGPDDPGPDESIFTAHGERCEAALGYSLRPLRHPGAGLAVAWSYGDRGIPGFILELEGQPTPGERFRRVRPFAHPQLGEVLLADDGTKLSPRNPPPEEIAALASRVWAWWKGELRRLPRLVLRRARIEATEAGLAVTGAIENVGELPTDTQRSRHLGLALPIRLDVRGGKAAGDLELEGLDAGVQRVFRLEVEGLGPSATLEVHHPRGGTIELPLRRPRRDTIAVRRDYDVPPAWRTPDRAVRASNAFYRDGVAAEERGPAFARAHTKDHVRVAVLLGEWQDRRHVLDASYFEQAFFSVGTRGGTSPTGEPLYASVRDAYREMSYGAFDVTGDVFDWVTLPGPWAEYRNASFGSRKLSDAMLAALAARDGEDALDGYDALAFVWAGGPVERTSALWPMKLTLRDRPGVVAFKTSELHRGHAAPIGVAVHELGHTFGIKDKYGLGATPQPLGRWCLMGRGTHGWEPSGTRRPFHLCAWCKQTLGWVRPVVIDPSTPQALALRPILYGPEECYRILIRPDGSEYLLLENRRREGLFTDLPSPGLVVLHVGPNDKPTAAETRVRLLAAHGLPPARRGTLAEPERVAWPQEGKTELEVEGVRVYDIQLVDDVIRFRLGR